MFEPLEVRCLLAEDYGDAPDVSAGTGRNDYATNGAGNGPRHTIVPGLRLGDLVDGEADAAPNRSATGDDVGGPSDEDGVVDPATDLAFVAGSQPTIQVRATNTTGDAATLTGWIDYNADGVFDTASESHSIVVSHATVSGLFTIAFPEVPYGFTGTTFLRLRLSTDARGESPTGPASDGEVEDYRVTITIPTAGTVSTSGVVKVADRLNGGPDLTQSGFYGSSVAAIGDLDGDGITEIAVGATVDSSVGSARGAVSIQFMNANGTVRSTTRIASGVNGGPVLQDFDFFGVSVAAIGDFDGDGRQELAVGAFGDDEGGANNGAVYVLFLNANGSVRTSTRLAAGVGGVYGNLGTGGQFGMAVAGLGDLNRDGIPDMAVTSPLDSDAGFQRGSVVILFMNRDGTVQSEREIGTANGGPLLSNDDQFGHGAAAIGDLDQDGISELAVGAQYDDTFGVNHGLIYILYLNPDGTVRRLTEIGAGVGLPAGAALGSSVSAAGDVDGDGTPDLLAGAFLDSTAGTGRGAAFVLYLTPDGALRSAQKIGSQVGGGPTLANDDRFGRSIARLGDLTGDGIVDIAVGAFGDNTGANDRGAVYILPLAGGTLDYGDAPDLGPGTTSGDYATTLSTNGPRHTIRAGLHLGSAITGESDALTNPSATGDDVGAIDDEDGLVLPPTGLSMTNTASSVQIRATNRTGTTATISVWIDSNRDGVFDNSTERVQHALPTDDEEQLVSITLPAVPFGVYGQSYLRIRLSTDPASGQSTGLATDGEVEDYAVSFRRQTAGLVDSPRIEKVASNTSGGPVLPDHSEFSRGLSVVGDIDGDGVADVVTSAQSAANGAFELYVLFMNADGTVREYNVIPATLPVQDFSLNGIETQITPLVGLGKAITPVGDINGDGVPDIIVSALDGNSAGTVLLINLNRSGRVIAASHLVHGDPNTEFGSSLSMVGDINGDGNSDLAIGEDSGGPSRKGAVTILFLDAQFRPAGSATIVFNPAVGLGNTNDRAFGSAVCSIGDLDGNGVMDIAVGACGGQGAVYLLCLNRNGEVIRINRIVERSGNPSLNEFDGFAQSLAALGDIDSDGTMDIAVGAFADSEFGYGRGVLYVMSVNPDGTTLSSTRIGHGTSGGPTLSNVVFAGTYVASAGDLNSDGVVDIMWSAMCDNTGGDERGAFYFLPLLPSDVPPQSITLSQASIPENSAPGTLVGLLSAIDPDVGDTFTFSLVAGTGADDNAAYYLVGNELHQLVPGNFESDTADLIRLRATDHAGKFVEAAFTVAIANVNEAPILDPSGNPFAILGAGSRQSTEMRQGVLVSEILARGAGGNPISDPDGGAQRGIALTAVDQSLGNFQYTLVTSNPQESDWVNVDAAGAVSNTSALLLPTTARLRFTTGRIPHHASAPFFLSVESKLDAGLTFRAWDQTSGAAGGRADTSTNGSASAFSSATETSKVYFEVRLFRSFNPNASLNVYTLEAEFNALTGGAFEDRSTRAYTGFTVLLSAVPELGTSALFRLYFGIQFNDNGTEVDMGYRYLTSNLAEAEFLEGSGPLSKRPQREGAYFREQGVSNGTATIGYVFNTQQPGTSQLTQIYRTDVVNKPTRPPETREGGTPTSFTPQENGDHVYTTNTSFETTRLGTWRVESTRGFVRELTPNPVAAAASEAATGSPSPATLSSVAPRSQAATTLNRSFGQFADLGTRPAIYGNANRILDERTAPSLSMLAIERHSPLFGPRQNATSPQESSLLARDLEVGLEHSQQGLTDSLPETAMFDVWRFASVSADLAPWG